MYCDNDECYAIVEDWQTCCQCGHAAVSAEKYIDLECSSVATINSNFASVASVDCNCENCEHYIGYRKASSQSTVRINQKLQMIQMTEQTTCDCCHQNIFIPMIFFAACGCVVHQECYSQHKCESLHTHQTQITRDMFCDCCLAYLELPIILLSQCGCIMHTYCFTRARRDEINMCPSVVHTKCKVCFYCSY